MGGRGTASGLTGASVPAVTPQAQAPTPAAQPAAPAGPPVTQQAPQPTPPRTITRADVAGLQRQMGQTGYEAGDPNAEPEDKVYVKTSKSFNINEYLRSGGRSIASKHSMWDRIGFTKADAARAVRQIDAGMKPLPYDLALTRFVGAGALGALIGDQGITDANASRIIANIATPQGAAKFARKLARANYTETAYTSTSYLQSHPAFDLRQIRLNIVAKKGTPAIITANHAEHEVLLGRGLPYRFTGGFRVVTTSKGVQQLEIDVEI